MRTFSDSRLNLILELILRGSSNICNVFGRRERERFLFSFTLYWPLWKVSGLLNWLRNGWPHHDGGKKGFGKMFEDRLHNFVIFSENSILVKISASSWWHVTKKTPPVNRRRVVLISHFASFKLASPYTPSSGLHVSTFSKNRRRAGKTKPKFLILISSHSLLIKMKLKWYCVSFRDKLFPFAATAQKMVNGAHFSSVKIN